MTKIGDECHGKKAICCLFSRISIFESLRWYAFKIVLKNSKSRTTGPNHLKTILYNYRIDTIAKDASTEAQKPTLSSLTLGNVIPIKLCKIRANN